VMIQQTGSSMFISSKNLLDLLIAKALLFSLDIFNRQDYYIITVWFCINALFL